MKPHTLFETPIWGFRYTHHQYQSFDYVNHIIKLSELTAGVSKSNQGGWQSSDDLHQQPIFRELFSHITDTCNQLCSEYTGDAVTGTVISAWANINPEHAFNYEHTHEGDISGVFYLQTPANSGKLIMVNPAVRSQSSLIRKPNFPVQPEPLALILFPSWLSHYVEPNHSNEHRISISFNYEVNR